jgi:hypothetical protein
LFDGHVHNENRRYSDRAIEMLNQAVKKGELVVDARLLEGFVPPAALARDESRPPTGHLEPERPS